MNNIESLLGYDSVSEFKQGVAIVRKNGLYGAIVVGNKEIIHPIYSYLGEFDNGLAKVQYILKGKDRDITEERMITMSGQVVVKHGDRDFFLPQEYDWGFDCQGTLFVVIRNGKYGVITENLNVVVPCEYECVELLCNALIKYRQRGKWGLRKKTGEVVVRAEYEDISIFPESKIFLRIEAHQVKREITEQIYGLLNVNGKLIIPLKYNTIEHCSTRDGHLFIVGINGRYGVYNDVGLTIVPVLFNQVSLSENQISCRLVEESDGKIIQEKGNCCTDSCVCYNFKGEQILKKENDVSILIPAEYDISFYEGMGLVRVVKDGKWGLIDIGLTVVLYPQYSMISPFRKGVAIVGISHSQDFDIKDVLSSKNVCIYNDSSCIYGAIDTRGNVIYPVECNKISLWKNGWYVIEIGYMSKVMTPIFSMSIKRQDCKFYYLNDMVIEFVEKTNDRSFSMWYSGIMDYVGNVILTPDNKFRFCRTQKLSDGFMKIDIGRGQWAIMDQMGYFVYNGRKETESVWNIEYIGKGLFLLRFYGEKNLVNAQGRKLLDRNYEEVKVLENGNIVFYDRDFLVFGMANYNGDVLMNPVYKILWVKKI